MIQNRPEPIEINSVKYDLTLFSGFIWHCKTLYCPNGLTIFLNFSHHCFTVKGTKEKSNYRLEGDNRNFSIQRFQDSRNLSSLMKSYLNDCQTRYIYIDSKDRNGAVNLMIFDDPDMEKPYHVYFFLQRSSLNIADIKLTVVSAYRTNPFKPRQRIKLGTELDRCINKLPKPKNKMHKNSGLPEGRPDGSVNFHNLAA